MTTGNNKKANNTIVTLTKTSQPKSSVIADADGNILTLMPQSWTGRPDIETTSIPTSFNQTQFPSKRS
ncbi:hypothetical protein DPMN_075898 [Dreissena polymorpha]|uniref:Uncharacterized protein n=1 Tax=Dreissena polymorpha TaxID=45954 RepID=A0A9D3YI40_DREPO|nr:hypothetical protein DPMN_075898 [Dreissena polymorpha]